MHAGLQAENRAESASSRLSDILARSQKNWLPLWMEEHYIKVRIAAIHQAEVHAASCQCRGLEATARVSAQGLEAVEPHAAVAWEQAGKAHTTLRAKLVDNFAAARDHAQGAWMEAGPTAKALLARTQVSSH